MRKNKIYAYNTHYRIYDYNLGDFPALEKTLIFHDYTSYEFTPRFYYDKINHVLYIPRGIDDVFLEQWNGKAITVVENKDEKFPIFFQMKLTPRDDTEKKAIRYLTGEEEFKSLRNLSQKVLIMPPGYGKTYCAVSAIQKIGLRTLIMVRTDTLRTQWIERLTEYTNLGGPNIVVLNKYSQLEKYTKTPPSDNIKIFITTRKLLISYMKRFGMESLDELFKIMKIGLKIYDETHQEYAATFLIDYATNVKYTFYLTATFNLSQYEDNRIFRAAYFMTNKLQIRQKEDARHIIYIAVMFNTRPNAIEEHKIVGKKRGFDRFEYIDYELEKGVLADEVRYMISFFLKEKKLKGKLLILSSKQSTCDYFNEIVQSEMNGEIKSCSFYTDNKTPNYKEYDAISATSGMLGTGEDIPGLRFLINTEPGSSLTNVDQFSGRLRPFEGGTKPTYYIEFIDMGFPRLYELYQKRKRLLKKKVKECYELNHSKLFTGDLNYEY